MQAELTKQCNQEKEYLAIRAILVYTTDCAKDVGDNELIQALQTALRITDDRLQQWK